MKLKELLKGFAVMAGVFVVPVLAMVLVVVVFKLWNPSTEDKICLGALIFLGGIYVIVQSSLDAVITELRELGTKLDHLGHKVADIEYVVIEAGEKLH